MLLASGFVIVGKFKESVCPATITLFDKADSKVGGPGFIRLASLAANDAEIGASKTLTYRVTIGLLTPSLRVMFTRYTLGKSVVVGLNLSSPPAYDANTGS